MKTEFETAKYAKRRSPGERSAEFIPLRTEYPSQPSPRGSGINSALQCRLLYCKSRDLAQAVKKFQRQKSESPLLLFPFSPLRADRRDALSHFGCGFAALCVSHISRFQLLFLK